MRKRPARPKQKMKWMPHKDKTRRTTRIIKLSKMRRRKLWRPPGSSQRAVKHPQPFRASPKALLVRARRPAFTMGCVLMEGLTRRKSRVMKQVARPDPSAPRRTTLVSLTYTSFVMVFILSSFAPTQRNILNI